MDSVLRPRDIQARIRAGESPERVAEAAQTTTDRIMAFAAPVLAERAYVAQQAQKASVRRRAGDGPVGQLGDAVSTRLAAQEVRADDVEWDAWRREDGRWTLVAEFAVAGSPHRAQFAYDAAGRYVVAEDDEARALVGERAGADRTEQLPLGDDAIEVVTGRRPAPLDEESTVDLTDTAAAVSPVDPFSARPPQPAAADWISTQASDRPRPEPVRRPEPTDLAPHEAAPREAALREVGPHEVGPHEAAPDEAAPHEAAEAAEAETAAPAEVADTLFDASELAPEKTVAPVDEGEQPPAEELPEPKKRPKAKSKGRASVPSWDEIMFGSNRGEG
jgi:Protein of unknown function (DUF3071)